MPKTYSEIPGVIVLAENEQGKIILCSSKGPRPTTADYFANGCIMLDLSEGKQYYNSGSIASPSWNSVADISSAEIADGAITNAKVASDAAIAITKIAVASQTAGDILYYSGTAWVRLAKGTDGQVLKLASGLPAWVT